MSLLSNATVSAMAGYTALAASQWLVVVIIVQALGISAAGQYGLAIAIATPVMALSRLQSKEIRIADVGERFRAGDYVLLRSVATATGFVAICLLVLVLGDSGHPGALIAVIGLARAAENLSDLSYAEHLRGHRLAPMARSMTARGLLGLLAFGAVVWMGGSLIGAAIAMTVAWGAVYLLLDHPVLLRMRSSDRETGREGSNWAALALAGAPLGIAFMLSLLNTHMPRYFTAELLGLRELGVLVAVANLIAPGQIAVSAFCEAASRHLAGFAHAGDLQAFRRLLAQLAACGAAVGLSMVVVMHLMGKPIIHAIYGPEMAEHLDFALFLTVVGAVSFAVTPVGYALTAMTRFRAQPLALLLSVTCNTVVSASAIGAYGLWGAAGGWLAGTLCYGLIGLAVLHRTRRRHWR